MGKTKKVEENPNEPPSEEPSNEGHNLLGAPKFKRLENGRFKCVQTGHELPAHAKDAYAESKHCRLGLIDYALARSKPPLNMFEIEPFYSSKLICKLTGVTINKTEKHIWKHINGKHFLSELEKKEAEKEMPNGTSGEQKDEEKELKKKKKKKKTEKKNEDSLEKKKKKKIKKEENVVENTNGVKDSTGKSSDLEKEAEFWMPPEGERWDEDDGGDRWGSDSESGLESDDDAGDEDADADADVDVDADVEEVKHVDVEEVKHADVKELSKKPKRTSRELGPISVSSKKKKKKTNV